MSRLTDQDYLLNEQYQDAGNLKARIGLHEGFSINKYGWFPWVFDQFDLPSDCRILELGCGPGDMWLENMSRISPGWEVTLSDFSPGMLEQAKVNLKDQAHGFVFELIDGQSIPYGDQRFEAVVANHMLYHVPDRPKALAEIRRVLKPKGQLYATTVGENHLRELPALLHKFDPNLTGDTLKGTENEFTLESGYPQLERFFSEVRIRRYEDDLVVTEAAPLVDYILSGIKLGVSGYRRQAFTEFIEQELDQHDGAIRITKDSGLLIAA
jgi:ubiquinone/menaquinone biosynthesis C-methylase UbiE